MANKYLSSQLNILKDSIRFNKRYLYVLAVDIAFIAFLFLFSSWVMGQIQSLITSMQTVDLANWMTQSETQLTSTAMMMKGFIANFFYIAGVVVIGTFLVVSVLRTLVWNFAVGTKLFAKGGKYITLHFAKFLGMNLLWTVVASPFILYFVTIFQDKLQGTLGMDAIALVGLISKYLIAAAIVFTILFYLAVICFIKLAQTNKVFKSFTSGLKLGLQKIIHLFPSVIVTVVVLLGGMWVITMLTEQFHSLRLLNLLWSIVVWVWFRFYIVAAYKRVD